MPVRVKAQASCLAYDSRRRRVYAKAFGAAIRVFSEDGEKRGTCKAFPDQNSMRATPSGQLLLWDDDGPGDGPVEVLWVDPDTWTITRRLWIKGFDTNSDVAIDPFNGEIVYTVHASGKIVLKTLSPDGRLLREAKVQFGFTAIDRGVGLRYASHIVDYRRGLTFECKLEEVDLDTGAVLASYEYEHGALLVGWEKGVRGIMAGDDKLLVTDACGKRNTVTLEEEIYDGLVFEAAEGHQVLVTSSLRHISFFDFATLISSPPVAKI